MFIKYQRLLNTYTYGVKKIEFSIPQNFHETESQNFHETESQNFHETESRLKYFVFD